MTVKCHTYRSDGVAPYGGNISAASYSVHLFQQHAAAVDTRGMRSFTIERPSGSFIAAFRAAVVPRMAAGAMALALIWLLANDCRALYETCAAWRTASVGTAADSRASRPGDGAGGAFGALAAAHLFGVSAPASRGAATAARDSSLVLTGIIATADPEVGYALIGTSQAQTSVHAVGSAVTQGVVLRAIYADHVVVERDGRLALVLLPRAPASSVLHPQLQESAESAAEGAADEAAGSSQQEVGDTLEKESERTAAVLQEKPYMPEGEFRGVLIEPGSNPAVLAQLGLKPGDVLHAVDRTTVDTDRLDMLRKRLASGQPVDVAVTRPGVGAIEFTVDSHLVAGMIEN